MELPKNGNILIPWTGSYPKNHLSRHQWYTMQWVEVPPIITPPEINPSPKISPVQLMASPILSPLTDYKPSD